MIGERDEFYEAILRPMVKAVLDICLWRGVWPQGSPCVVSAAALRVALRRCRAPESYTRDAGVLLERALLDLGAGSTVELESCWHEIDEALRLDSANAPRPVPWSGSGSGVARPDVSSLDEVATTAASPRRPAPRVGDPAGGAVLAACRAPLRQPALAGIETTCLAAVEPPATLAAGLIARVAVGCRKALEVLMPPPLLRRPRGRGGYDLECALVADSFEGPDGRHAKRHRVEG
jgi:hypothetical protein